MIITFCTISNSTASGHAGHNQLNQAEDDTSLPTQFGGLTSIINTGEVMSNPDKKLLPNDSADHIFFE